MTTCRFLVDECVSADFIRGVRAHEPAIEIQQVGERGAPRKGTLAQVKDFGADFRNF